MVTIRIRGLTKRFGDSVALRGLDLDIAAGELFFLLGPSGCGKTTLLRSIAGFHLPDEGTIHFDGDEVSHVPPHRRETAMMFQSYALWPHLNVFRNVAFGLEERKVPRAEIRTRVQQALDMVKMGDFAQRKINQLSGGQQQRVALARALVVRPRCLMLDEPLSNLDAKLRIEMRTEIRRICKEFGLTAIYVTHDQKEALSIADRMAILDGGRIVQIGAPEEIYRHPHTATVASFIGETNFIPGLVASPPDTEGNYDIETDLGPFQAHPGDGNWQPRLGDRVLLSIRPECLSLQNARPPINAIAGRLAESTYLGETAHYALKTGAEPDTIHIAELNPRRVIRDRGDETWHATADTQDIVMVPAG
ncbi:MAG: ABC transporter ATP-binding protein [Verrucomicrobiales bacterium]|nr:ABC transporter ATP-binding protein [Verrucomicrobiales bacterium]